MTLNASPLNSTPLNGVQAQETSGVFLDKWLKYIRSDTGIAQDAVTVTVYNAVDRTNPQSGDNTLADLFSDVLGGASITNPLVTVADGKVLFYAAPGFYHIKLTKNAETTWLANEPIGTLKGVSPETLLGKLDFSVLPEAADDTAAEAEGVEIGRLYRTGSTIKTRIA